MPSRVGDGDRARVGGEREAAGAAEASPRCEGPEGAPGEIEGVYAAPEIEHEHAPLAVDDQRGGRVEPRADARAEDPGG